MKNDRIECLTRLLNTRALRREKYKERPFHETTENRDKISLPPISSLTSGIRATDDIQCEKSEFPTIGVFKPG